MKSVIVYLLLFCVVQDSFGQVTGQLISATGKPVSFANVLLLNSKDTSLVKALLTDEKGSYTFIGITAGNYIIRVSSINYQPWNSPAFTLTTNVKNKDMGTHILQEENKQLDEVVVRAEKPLYQQQPEGTIVNVESSILTKGSSALQVLERSPGVVINHRDNSISLNGKSGVMVMLNGKLMRMSMEQVVALLNNMSADDIATIELLTTPPAKYDAEGSAGLINIVLKKNKKMGTNGSVSLTGGYGYGEKATGSINLAHNTKNLDVYGSYTYSHNKTYSELYITSTQNMPFLGGQVAVLFLDTTKVNGNSHNATIGADLKLNAKTTVGASINYDGSSNFSTTLNNAGYNILPDSLLQFMGINKGTSHWNNLVNSVYLEKQIKPGEKINFDMDYLYFSNDGNSQVQSSFVDEHGVQAGNGDHLFSPQQKGFAHTIIQVAVAKTDYTKQLAKQVKLETGIKATYTKSSSTSGLESFVNGAWATNSETVNNIVMKEGIAAAYADVNVQINASTNMVAGARYEYAYTNMNDTKTGNKIVNRKLGALFPSLFFSKKINDHSELQLSYTKRISRPSYNDLASYVGYSDPTAVYTGNPFLQPTITNNIKLGYNYKGYSFSLLFSLDKNPIARYQLTESPAKNILFISPQNLAWQNNAGFQTSIPLKINNWWTMTYGFTGSLISYKVDYTLYPFQKTYFNYSLNFSQAFKLPGRFSTEISGWYTNTFYNGSVKIDGYGVLSFGIKKELKNNGGSFQLSVADFLRSERINVHYGSLTREAFDIKSHVIVTTESAKFPIIKLTYSRPFGRGSKSQRKPDNSSGDEKERIRKE